MSDLFKLSLSKERVRNISAIVWKRASGDPTHPENASDADWQAGYLVGCHTERESMDDITSEWRIRGNPGNGTMEPAEVEAVRLFRNWKAGYWAGVFAHLGENRTDH